MLSGCGGRGGGGGGSISTRQCSLEGKLLLARVGHLKLKVMLVCHLVAIVGNAGISSLQAQLQEALWWGRKKGDLPPGKPGAQRVRDRES